MGRVLSEVLAGGALPEVSSRVITSEPAANGLVTVLDMQQIGQTRYFDVAGFPGRTVGLSITQYQERQPSRRGGRMWHPVGADFAKAAGTCNGCARLRRQASQE